MPLPTDREELLRVWQGRIQLACDYQDKFGDTQGRWKKNIKAMAGDFDSVSELGDEAVDVNMVRSNIKSTLPPLYISEPHLVVKPRVRRFKGADNIARARFTEIELNYWLRELGVRHEVRKVAHDGEATNLGYLYIGYIKGERDKHFDFLPSARVGRPFIRRISPKQVKVPPGYGELEEMPWVSIEFLRPKLAVVEKFGLDNEQAEKLPTDDYFDSASGEDRPAGMQEYLDSDDAKLVHVHNIWDKESKKVYVVVPDFDDFLEDPSDWPYKVEGFPLAIYHPEYVSDEYHATPPISFYYQQNKELNANRTFMAKRQNRSKDVILTDGTIGQEVIDKYKNAKDGEWITVDLGEQEGKLSDHVMPLPGLQLDTSDLAYDEVIKADIREQSSGANRRGVSEPGVESATETAEIAKGEQIREADRSDGIRSLYITAARKLWMVLKQHPNVKRTRLIAGALAGEFVDVEYTLAELEGEFDFSMDLGTALSLSPRERQRQASVRYNLMRADPKVDANRLILDMLDADQVPNPDEYLLELKQPQQEHQLMVQGLPVVAHERDEHQVHLTEHLEFSGQLNDAITQLDVSALRQNIDNDTPQRVKLSTAQILLIAHIQDHIRILGTLTGGEGRPVAENLLRSQSKIGAGTETEAELTGQPLT